MRKTGRDKYNPVKAGEIVSFRVSDAVYAEKFNLALRASGETRAFLASKSVDLGLAYAVWELSEGRGEALKEFQKAVNSHHATAKLPPTAQNLPPLEPLIVKKDGEVRAPARDKRGRASHTAGPRKARESASK